MKAHIVKERGDFEPFQLMITVETEQEARQLLRQLDNVKCGDYLTVANVLRTEMERQGY